METKPVTEAVSATVRAELARRKMTHASVAEILGLSTAGVSRRLAGQTPFDVDEIATIAKALDLPVSDLFGGAA